MAIATMVLDPNAAAYTDNEIVGKINTATANITRANSVDPTARPIADAEVTSTKLDAGVAKANLDAMADIDRSYVKTNPLTGQFKVIAIERQADGKLKVEYDDVAV